MKEDKNIINYFYNNDDKKIFTLKTNPIKDAEGNIIEPARYLDAEQPMNVIGETPEFSKEQLKDLKAKLQSEIDKTTKKVPYDDLIEASIYNSSDAVREHAKEEIERRILSGEVKYVYAAGIEKTPEQTASKVLNDLAIKRMEYLQSVSQSKGNAK